MLAASHSAGVQVINAVFQVVRRALSHVALNIACLAKPPSPLPAQAPPKPLGMIHAAAHAAEGANPAGLLSPAAAAQRPSPMAALRLETCRVHGWADAQGRAYVQLELRLANDNGAAVPDVIIACPACEVQTL